MNTMQANSRSELPVAVIGAGPVGLVAAAHLLSRGETPLVLEAGSHVGASVLDWGHVRLFSPWKHLTEPVTRSMLQGAGWTAPDPERLPTGVEFVERFLDPLALLPKIEASLRLNRQVVAIARSGFDKVKSAGREGAPFELVVRTGDGRSERHLARSVIDASGTYRNPNPAGASGIPVDGEAGLADRIAYGIPDILGRDRSRYAGRRTLVIGSGHSAFNVVLDLGRVGAVSSDTEIVWAVRREEPGLMFGEGQDDALPARGRLGADLGEIVARGAVEFVTGFRTASMAATRAGVVVRGDDDGVIGPVDELIVTTGFRPDLAMLRELRVDLDPWLEAPRALAPLIDPNLHSCGTVPLHGYEELRQPERDFFVIGMKSYGRAPTFLVATGYEQARSVAAALSGDLTAAREVGLVQPGNSACSADAPGISCSAPNDEGQTSADPVSAAVGGAPADCACSCASGSAGVKSTGGRKPQPQSSSCCE